MVITINAMIFCALSQEHDNGKLDVFEEKRQPGDNGQQEAKPPNICDGNHRRELSEQLKQK